MTAVKTIEISIDEETMKEIYEHKSGQEYCKYNDFYSSLFVEMMTEKFEKLTISSDPQDSCIKKVTKTNYI